MIVERGAVVHLATRVRRRSVTVRRNRAEVVRSATAETRSHLSWARTSIAEAQRSEGEYSLTIRTLGVACTTGLGGSGDTFITTTAERLRNNSGARGGT